MVFTTCAVAAAVHWLIGLPLAVGFVLGAIVAPPDVVAPLAIVRRLGLPRRLVVVLEGEGLANDATALILYRFAVAAVSTGLFSFGQAAGVFALIVVGEIAYGIAIGWVSLRLRRWARDPRVEITLSLLTPYAAFLLPQQLGGSGVLATVAAGLYVSWNGPLLIPAATRLQGIFFWDFLVYLLEGLIFLITGMQTRTLLDRMSGNLLHDLLIAVLITVVVIVVTRFVWMFPAVYLPRWLSASLRRRDPVAALAMGFSARFRRRARCRVACRGAGHSADDRNGLAVSRPRSHSVCHLCGHRHHPDRPGSGAAGGGALARSWPRCRTGAQSASIRPSWPRAPKHSISRTRGLSSLSTAGRYLPTFTLFCAPVRIIASAACRKPAQMAWQLRTRRL